MTRTELNLLTVGHLLGQGYDADEVRRILRLAANSRLFRAAKEFHESKRQIEATGKVPTTPPLAGGPP